MYVAGGLHLERLLSKRYQLDEINEALADLEAGRALRPLIEIDSTIS
jgi:Zn-dependent alcohol dehydrogenase